jgi:small subunit ribosomal protein S18
MAKTSSRKRMKPKPVGRKGKKKISPLSSESVQYVDYKDVELLKRFMSDRAKIRARRVSGNDSQQQREVARAIKNAREMGLLPYASRVTTQRRNNRRDDGPRDRDRDRDGGGDRQNDKAPDQAEAQVAESTPAETTETGGEE